MQQVAYTLPQNVRQRALQSGQSTAGSASCLTSLVIAPGLTGGQ